MDSGLNRSAPILALNDRPGMAMQKISLNLRRSGLNIREGRDLGHSCVGEPVMPKAAHIFAPMEAFRASPEKSDGSPLGPIVLFGGLASWYS
jgi:hypothetical protein